LVSFLHLNVLGPDNKYVCLKQEGDSFKHLQLKDKIMKLIGTLDSPYVRRVAISLNYYGIHFKHEPMSVFSNLERFKSINPVLKAPTLVLDDQTILLDSSLILDYFETEQQNKRKLMPETRQERSRSLRQIGLALANDPLKQKGAYGVPVWRKIQLLADIRNMCSHQKDETPSKEQV
jgi:hypothetical protein